MVVAVTYPIVEVVIVLFPFDKILQIIFEKF